MTSGMARWGRITEIDVDDIPDPSWESRWGKLIEELTLRLEQTRVGRALVVPIDGGRDAEFARQRIIKHFATQKPCVNVKMRKLNGISTLFVYHSVESPNRRDEAEAQP